MAVIWRRGNNGKRRGEISFARAKNDVGLKWAGGYAPPMADVRAKYFSPVQMDDWGCEEICVCVDGDCAAVWKPRPFLVCRA